MKHDLFMRITKMGVVGLIGLGISTLAVAGDQPLAAAQPGLEEIVSVLNAKAQAVDAALSDMRANLKVAADLQSKLEKEAGRKGQAEAAAKAGQDACKAAEQNISDLKSRMAAAEKELAALDKQKKSVAKLQETLTQLSQQRVEAESEAQRVQAARAAAEQSVAEWKAKVEEAVKMAQAAGEPGKAALKLEEALKQEQGQREAALKQTTEAQKALEKAEKEKGKLQAQVDEQVKRVAEGQTQQKAADQIQAELVSEKQARTESEAKVAEANQACLAAAQAIAELKQKVVEGEKQSQALDKRGEILAQRQDELAKARKLNAEAAAALQQTAVAKTAADQNVTALKARLEEISQKAATAQEQAKQVQSLQDEIGKEKQLRESRLQDAAKAREAVQAAEKEKDKLQAQVDEQVKRVAAGLNQQKAADQIQAELASEKQARTESEAKIAEANQARAAAAQTITELKQKVVEGEKQYLAPEKNAKALAKLQAELADIRKTNAEVTREVQSVTASRAETEQTVTVLNAKFTTVQTNISALTEQAGVIKQAQVELKTWKQANAAAVEHLNKEKAIADAAEKEKTGLQSRVAELEKQAAEEAGRQKALEQLKGNLAQAKQAWTETEAKLTSTTESQEAARKETADLQRKIKDMENQLDKQAKETMTLKDTQTELSKAQKIRGDLEAKVEKKAQALAAMDKEQSALKSQLADMEKQYAAGQEQMKVAAQAQADLKQERDLRDQADKRMTKMAAQEKARATQIGDLNDQLQTASKKNAALAKDLEHQSQAAVAPAVESKQGSGEPESVTATEKKILAQAKGESETGAAEAAQGADKAKTTEASGVFIPAVSDANRHYMIGIQKWDAGDVDSAIAEFKKTISLDSSLAGAYYNIALGYSRKGDRDEACDYAYQAGKIYLKNKNNQQATRMVVLIRNINPSSSLIDKLRKEISKKQQ